MINKYLKNSEKVTFIIFYCIIFLGVILAIFQFISNRSLWLDEASLAINIINRNFLELLTPLGNNQVAPIGFLYVEKLFTLIFGKNEFSLRLFPLLGFLFSIPIMYLLTKVLTKNKTIALMSTSFFSITMMLIRYSTEVKQYSIDVLAVIMLLYLSEALQLQKNRSLYIFSIVGSIVIWFSNVSIILLTVIGIYTLITEFWYKKNYKILLAYILWLVSFSIYYYFFIYNHPTTSMMKNYWRDSFLPLNPFSPEFYGFLFKANKEIFTYLLGISNQYWFLVLVVSLFGIFFLLRDKNYKTIVLLLSPILLHLLLSGLKLYPFSGRLILYSIPIVIIFYSIGLYIIFKFLNENFLNQKIPLWLLTLPILIMGYSTYSNLKTPIQREEIKHSIKYIEKNIQKGETLYIYYASMAAFQFYQDSNITNIGNKIVRDGWNNRNQNHKYDQKLLNLKGKVWLLFSHVYDKEEKYMIDLLLNNNSKLLDSKKYHGSSLYYIDMDPDNEDYTSALNAIGTPSSKSFKE